MSVQTRFASVPLITVDPYFSVWAPGDTLCDANTVHWTGIEQPIIGVATVDGRAYRFLGRGEGESLVQTGLVVTPTQSIYTLEGAGIELEVRFTTPLLLFDLELVSRPCSYIDFAVRATDGAEHTVDVRVSFDQAHCCAPKQEGEPCAIFGGMHDTPAYQTGWMGKAVQTPLGHSGDSLSIDWGHLYAAVPRNMGNAGYEQENGRCRVYARLSLRAAQEKQKAYIVAAYDDGIAIQYFSHPAKAYWARNGKTILTAIEEAVCEHDVLLSRCSAFDAELLRQAREQGGEPYATVCALAYRQSIAGHKLIADQNGEVVFLSKECHSNGCIGTVDVSYPSVPLFLLYQPELVKGMLRPIFEFARMPVWEYDFAPHDVGRYPYATGQVYGLRADHEVKTNGKRVANEQTYPPYYQYPAGSQAYALKYQMPVEECGNMLIMTQAVVQATGDAGFARAHMDLLEKWVCYLIEYGSDPGEQLCTDDFAGHLAHNVNLAAKAIMGIASYALLLEALGRGEEAGGYLRIAREMAADWEKRAAGQGHTRLTFDQEEGWSLKYNLVWDLLFGTQLFTPELFSREIAWYKQAQNTYGVPLDSRKEYTKTDWILWCAAMAEDPADREELVRPICRFLEQTPDRVPFSDWYDTLDAKHHRFQNRTVQGGLFMPLLRAKLRRDCPRG